MATTDPPTIKIDLKKRYDKAHEHELKQAVLEHCHAEYQKLFGKPFSDADWDNRERYEDLCRRVKEAEKRATQVRDAFTSLRASLSEPMSNSVAWHLGKLTGWMETVGEQALKSLEATLDGIEIKSLHGAHEPRHELALSLDDVRVEAPVPTDKRKLPKKGSLEHPQQPGMRKLTWKEVAILSILVGNYPNVSFLAASDMKKSTSDKASEGGDHGTLKQRKQRNPTPWSVLRQETQNMQKERTRLQKGKPESGTKPLCASSPQTAEDQKPSP